MVNKKQKCLPLIDGAALNNITDTYIFSAKSDSESITLN